MTHVGATRPRQSFCRGRIVSQNSSLSTRAYTQYSVYVNNGYISKIQLVSHCILNRFFKNGAVQNYGVIFSVFSADVYAPFLHIVNHGAVNLPAQIFPGQEFIVYALNKAFITQIYRLFGIFPAVPLPQRKSGPDTGILTPLTAPCRVVLYVYVAKHTHLSANGHGISELLLQCQVVFLP